MLPTIPPGAPLDTRGLTKLLNPRSSQLPTMVGAAEVVGAMSIGGWMNVKASNTRRIKRMRGGVLDRSRQGLMLIFGSSSPAASGAGSGGTGRVGARARWMGARAAAVMAARGIPAEGMQNFFGTANYWGDPYSDYDTRIAALTGWTEGTVNSLGGQTWRHAVANTNALAFTAAAMWNTVVSYQSKVTSGTNTEITCDGVVKSTVSNTGTLGDILVTTSIADTTKIQAAAIRKASAVTNSVNVIGMRCYDSANPVIQVLGAGWGGSESSAWTENSVQRSPINAIGVLAPDFALGMVGLNDWYKTIGVGALPVSEVAATLKANQVLLGTKVQQSGDYGIVIPQYSDPSVVPYSTQDACREALYEAANILDCVLLDAGVRLGTFEERAALGLNDGEYHFKAPGHADIGLAIGDLVSRCP